MSFQEWIPDVIAKATVMLVIVAIADRAIMRTSAATRHRLWSTAFLMLLLLPIFSATIPQWRLAILPISCCDPIAPSFAEDTGGLDNAARIADRSRLSQYIPLSSLTDSSTGKHKLSNSVTPTASLDSNANGVSNTEYATSARWSIGWLLFAAWAVGSLFAIAPLLRGMVATAKMRRSAVRITDQESASLLTKLCARLGIGRRVEILESDNPVIPMTWGILRPTIIVPREWQDWTIEIRRLVLFHELAHVKRFDSAYQTVARIACSLYWFHPLAWYALARLRIERELACDDCVWMSGVRPSSYAKQLLQLARQFQSSVLPPAVAMAQRNGLEFRVRSLLDQSRSRLPVSSRVARTLLATSLAMVTLLATVRLDAVAQVTGGDAKPNEASTVSQSEEGKPRVADQRAGVETRDAEMAELAGGQLAETLKIRVVDPDGKPIAGAKVNPWALRSSQGHGSWQPDQYDRTVMVPETANSGRDGIATIKYPFYRYVSERIRTTAVSILVSHPEFVMTDSIEIDVPLEHAGPFEVQLEAGANLELLPSIDGTPIRTDNLFVSWSDIRSVRRFNRELKLRMTDLGAIRLPPMRAGANSVLVAQIENDRATYLSAVMDVELVFGEDNKIEIPLIKATPIVGKLSDNVPRPVREGRVVLEMQRPPDAHECGASWDTWVPIQEDGSFTINAWPPGEVIQAIAICEGFHSVSVEASHEVTDPEDHARLDLPRVQVFREGEPIEINMVPMANWIVTVLDEYRRPVAGVDVQAWPWTNYAASYLRSEMYLQGRDDQDSYPHRFHQKSDEHGKLTMQLPAGKSTFTVTSDVYELPIIMGKRQVRVDSEWGQAHEVTLHLQPRGTNHIGEWDNLLDVDLGLSISEARRICALPGVQKKMDAFAKQFRETKDPQDPQLLSEAFTTIAEAFAAVGDLEEATKWHRKAAEQQARANQP